MSRLEAAAVISCEHASCALPPGVDLGIAADVCASHVGWDPGAEPLARALAAGLQAPLHLGRWSRLWVDLNRREEAPEVIPTDSFGVVVPGNRGLPPEERERRLASEHRPYRAAVRAACARALERARACLHLSCHSFTPELNGRRREVEVGILFDPARPFEAALADALIDALRAAGWDARANEPYLGVDDGLTTWLRPQLPQERYAGIEVELSQGLDRRAQARLAAELPPLVAGVVQAV